MASERTKSSKGENPVILTWEQRVSVVPELIPGSNRLEKALRAINKAHGFDPRQGDKDCPKKCMDAHYQLRRSSSMLVRISLHADGTHTLEQLS